MVSDTSPLISLTAIEHLELLKHLYERVLIPDAVYQELTDSDTELPGAAEVRTLEWIVSQPVQNEMVVRALQVELNYGEAAALALAVELQADIVLIDERRARAVASRLGLNGRQHPAQGYALLPILSVRHTLCPTIDCQVPCSQRSAPRS